MVNNGTPGEEVAGAAGEEVAGEAGV